MKTLKDEYLPSEDEASPSNETSGNGKPAPKEGRRFNLALFSAVRDDHRVRPHGAFRLWCKLYDMSGSSGQCYPGIRALCWWMRSAERSVIKWLKLLVGLRYLDRERITTETSPEPHKHGGFFYSFPADALSKSRRKEADAYWRTVEDERQEAYAKKRSPKSAGVPPTKPYCTTTNSPPKSPSGGPKSSGAARRGKKGADEKNRESGELRSGEILESGTALAPAVDPTPDPEASNEEMAGGGWTKKAARELLRKTQNQLRNLERDPKNFTQVLHQDVQEAVAWLEQEAQRLKAAGETSEARHKLADAAQRRRNRGNYQRGPLKPEVLQLREMLQRRAAELEAVLHRPPRPEQIRIPKA